MNWHRELYPGEAREPGMYYRKSRDCLSLP